MVSKKDKDLAQKKKLREEQTGFAGGTITDAARVAAKGGLGETSLERQERACVSNGGKWDAENQRCIRVPELEAQALKERQEAAKETVSPTEPTLETPTPTTEVPAAVQTEGTPEERGLVRADDLGMFERANIDAGRFIDIDGEKFVFPEGQGQRLSTFGNVVAGSVEGGAAGFTAGLSAVSRFLSNAIRRSTTKEVVKGATKAAAPGSRALGTNPRALGTNPRAIQAVLTAPAKLKTANGVLKTALITGASFFGLGQLKSLSTDLLLAESKKIRGKVSLVGEKLTKIPETSSHGFTLEDGVVTEYTQAMALIDIAEVEQTLFDAQQQLQQFTIGNAFLKLKGDHDIALDEVDKQLGEVAVAQSKVLEQIAAPSEKQLAVKEFWAGVDLE